MDVLKDFNVESRSKTTNNAMEVERDLVHLNVRTLHKYVFEVQGQKDCKFDDRL